jgi:hypothetical protein
MEMLSIKGNKGRLVGLKGSGISEDIAFLIVFGALKIKYFLF